MKNTPLVLLFGLSLLIGCTSDHPDWQISEKKINGKDICITKPNAKNFLAGWKTDNVLYVHMASEPPTLHFTNENNASRTIITNLCQRFLMMNDPINQNITPDLVKSFPEISNDDKDFTYELRNDITFDDGSPVTNADVAFTFKVLKCPLTKNTSQKDYLINLISIMNDPDNDKRFTLKMQNKYIQNIHFLTECPIMQQKFYDPENLFSKYTLEQISDTSFAAKAPQAILDWENSFNGTDYCSNPKFMKGLGAYQITEWKQGVSVTLEKKKNHWTSKVKNPNPYETSYPEKIIFIFNKDENSEILELKNQTYDVTNFLSTKSMLDLAQDENFRTNYNFDFIEQFTYSYMAFNMKPDGINHKSLFTDKNVRRAIALLTPVQDIINSMANGKATRYVTMTSPLKPECDRSLKPLPLDIEGAKKLLDDAGWIDSDNDGVRDKMINGEKINLEFELQYVGGNTLMDAIIALTEESLNKGGVKLIPKPVAGGLLIHNASTHDFDAFILTWSSSSAPEDYSQIWKSENWANGGSNFTGFGNAETDKLIDDIRFATDTSVRYPLCKKFQQIIYDEQPYVFLYSPYRKVIIHKRWGNCIMTFDRPGYVLNNLMLLSGNVNKAGFDY